MAAMGGRENFHRQGAKTPEKEELGFARVGVLSRDSLEFLSCIERACIERTD